MQRSEDGRTVQAVQTTCEIVDLLRERGRAGVTELANELDLSKGTVHCQLATLAQNEFVVKRDNDYQLSLRYLDFGEHIKERLGIYDVVQEEVNDLAKATNELAQFATEEYGRAVYVYKASGQNAVQTASNVGMREYLHCISLGKAMLAHFPESQVKEIVEYHGLPTFTDNTITDQDDLLDELADTRERGYAIDRGEKIEGLRCIAAPVTESTEKILGAVSVSGPSRRMEGAWFDEELPQQVRRSANVIEINAQFS